MIEKILMQIVGLCHVGCRNLLRAVQPRDMHKIHRCTLIEGILMDSVRSESRSNRRLLREVTNARLPQNSPIRSPFGVVVFSISSGYRHDVGGHDHGDFKNRLFVFLHFFSPPLLVRKSCFVCCSCYGVVVDCCNHFLCYCVICECVVITCQVNGCAGITES